MNEQKTVVGCVVAITKVCVQLPIWYYLLYVILTAIEADNLAWFLYWVYVPAGVIVAASGSVMAVLFERQPNSTEGSS